MKRAAVPQMTNAYFAYTFSRGYFYAGFFGYAKCDLAAADSLHEGRGPGIGTGYIGNEADSTAGSAFFYSSEEKENGT